MVPENPRKQIETAEELAAMILRDRPNRLYRATRCFCGGFEQSDTAESCGVAERVSVMSRHSGNALPLVSGRKQTTIRDTRKSKLRVVTDLAGPPRTVNSHAA
jgi:hypothetical protein